MTNTETITALRNRLKELQGDGFILPVTDEYQGEYSAEYARRVTWLTGFDGSAGMVVILPETAALLVDGRYTLQAAHEVDTSLYTVHNSAEMSLSHYLAEHTSAGQVIGYDPWLHSVAQIRRLEQSEGAATLAPLEANPVDALWHNQPGKPQAPIFQHELRWAGRTSADKISDTIAALTGEALLVTQPEALCWLLNIRGGDIPFNPLPLCYGVVMASGEVMLVIDPAKVPEDVLPQGVRIIPEADIANYMDELAVQVSGPIQLDPTYTPVWFSQRLRHAGATIIEAANPITRLKAIKNPTEIDGMRRAHVVDGQAVQQFIRWYETLPEGEAVSELQVIDKLEECRRQHPDYLGPSFATIAGGGPHGAIIHYRAGEASNRLIGEGEPLLLDSGGQYPYGTTDITRTLCRGEAPDGFRHAFTLVLKGHIALAEAVFPEGTTGHQLDTLARQYLWAAGMDYQHGTGHGVGCYLCVHEGPQSISPRHSPVALEPGMVLSNEPGYYIEGEYGIRIESLILVVERDYRQGRRYFGFETLTRVPIDTRLVDFTLLTEAEQRWLNTHNRLAAGSEN